MQLKVSKFEDYEGDTLSLAQTLLGKILIFEQDGQIQTSGRIVETEAYLQNDPACHAAFNKRTQRNEVMFWSAGHAYVYLIYGLYYCFNVVSNQKDIGEAVLIRALEPLEGLSIMKERRGANHTNKDLCNGPGKLCQAMGISLLHNGLNLNTQPIWIADQPSVLSEDIVSTTRIGIQEGASLPYRFYLRNHPCVSKK